MPTNLHDITIVSGAVYSNIVNLRTTETVVGVIIPSGFTVTPIGFLVSPYKDPSISPNTMAYNGAEYLASGVGSVQLVLDPSLFVGVRQLQIRSGSAGAPVAQGGNRTMVLITQEL